MATIYHITHIDNLTSILDRGGLCCDNRILVDRVATIGIAHGHIKERRARKRVLIGPGGTLADYVPFYFAPRSPMLYAIHRGNVAGYNGTQRSIVHLTSSTDAVAEHQLPFVFYDGHAVMELSRPYADLADLRHIDWQIMQARYWNDTNADGDRTRRRSAEFLIHYFVPWDLIGEIGVLDSRIMRQVSDLIRHAPHVPEVAVHREWYY